MWALRVAMLCMVTMVTVSAISVESIYGLLFICSDLIYVILFPQLLCVLYIPFSNSYGCLLGYFLGLLARFVSGEPYLQLAPLVYFPLYSEENGQGFPVRTFSRMSVVR